MNATSFSAPPPGVPVDDGIGGGVDHIGPVRRRVKPRDVLASGDLVRVLVARDLKVKYKQSLLGPVWLVFQPLAMLVAFVVGFHTVAHVTTQGVPYVLFALTGLSMWSYFSAASTAGAISLVGNTNLVRFTACPRPVLVIANLTASLPALVVPASAAIIAAVASGYVHVQLLLIPLMVVWLFVLTAAFTAVLAALAVRYRDVSAALPFVLQFGVFFAPVAYPANRLHGLLGTLISLNPLTGVIDAWRWVVLGVPPDGFPLALAGALTIPLALASWSLFARLEVTMADDI